MDNDNFLLDKAERFERNAKELFEREDCDLSAFNIEQAAQLYIKHYLYQKVGDFQKIHPLDELLEDVGKIPGNESEIESFRELNKKIIRDIDDAYIRTRYYPQYLFPEQVEEMFKLIDDLKKLLKSL